MPVRIAIVGTGNIARTHARAVAGIPSATLAGAMDVDSSRLDPFCEEYGVAEGCRDLGDLLSRARPDLVHICTPPATHYAAALECLNAGASVLVEKPPVISLRELDGLAAAQGPSRPGGTREPPWFATVFQHRFGSGQRRLKAVADSGALGRPLVAVCHTTWFRDQAYFDVPWRGGWDNEGGGPTMGHGIHQMDMLADVLGDWTEVSALARTSARVMATEDLSLAHVSFANGAVASVVNSVLSPREETYLRFDYEYATVEVTHLYGYADADWRITPAKGHSGEVQAAWDDAEYGTKSGHAAQFAHVLDALRDGRQPPVAPGEARRTMSLVAGIYASAFTRRPVTPDDLAPGTPFYGAMNGGKTAPWQ
ncbi:MAG: Gfo/Idh/MocA family oxidoreductase [Nocardiopsaceae bacterium]|nr:Gfo/Idh/MocA family oxidoreductase [Nocardiopsaceae bacterium]